MFSAQRVESLVLHHITYWHLGWLLLQPHGTRVSTAPHWRENELAEENNTLSVDSGGVTVEASCGSWVRDLQHRFALTFEYELVLQHLKLSEAQHDSAVSPTFPSSSGHSIEDISHHDGQQPVHQLVAHREDEIG